jgi:hypothetical protein
MSSVDYPGVGSQADQYARLQHASERHGFALLPCPKCDGRRGGCAFCEDPAGIVFTRGDLTPCGPRCPLNDIRPA